MPTPHKPAGSCPHTPGLSSKMSLDEDRADVATSSRRHPMGVAPDGLTAIGITSGTQPPLFRQRCPWHGPNNVSSAENVARPLATSAHARVGNRGGAPLAQAHRARRAGAHLIPRRLHSKANRTFTFLGPHTRTPTGVPWPDRMRQQLMASICSVSPGVLVRGCRCRQPVRLGGGEGVVVGAGPFGVMSARRRPSWLASAG
jgi:hypothetical protein